MRVVQAACLLGLFAANSSLGVFLSLYESSTSRLFLGKCTLCAAKLGEELDVSVLWVKLGSGL